MKPLLLIAVLSITCGLQAQQPCYLKIGAAKLSYGADPSLPQSLNMPMSLFKSEIYTNLFGNIYYYCNGNEIKVQSFKLTIRNGNNKPAKFSRNYPSNYILANDTINNLLKKNKLTRIDIDSIYLFTHEYAPSISVSAY